MIYRMLRFSLPIFLFAWSLQNYPGQSFAQNGAWDGLISAGREALKVDAFSEAERYFEDALELAERFPPGDPRLGRSLNNLAALYYKQEDYDRAEPLMRRSLAVLEESLGPNNADVAQTKKNLAAIYYLQGDFSDAEPLLKESLGTLEDLHGPNHAFVATILNHLAVLYQAQDRYSEAEPLLERSLRIWEGLLGKNNPDVIKSRELLARLREANKSLTAQSETSEEKEVAETTVDDQPLPIAPVQADQLIALSGDAEAAVVEDLGADGPASQALEALAASELAAAYADDADINGNVFQTQGEAITNLGNEARFAVYLSTLWSEEEARRYWQALKDEIPEVLADREMEIEKIALADGGGSFYRVLTTPFVSDPAAQAACDEIRLQIRTHDCSVIAR